MSAAPILHRQTPAVTHRAMAEFTLQSDLGISPEAFWSSMSMKPVNRELGPWVRMTAPLQWRDWHGP